MKPPIFFESLLPVVASPVVALAVVLFVAGCAGTSTSRSESEADLEEATEEGYVFYLDGAGGATARTNWSERVREGLLDGGYQGTGEIFAWEKSSGRKANEDASPSYKRKKADELTWVIEDRLEEFPDAPVEIIGHAAGSVVVLYALEALPEAVQVENVVLLGASLEEDYDLTDALKRVKGSLTVFTVPSEVPDAEDAGLAVPVGASGETLNLYAEKLTVISSDASLGPEGDSGHLEKAFIRDQVAPLLMGGGAFIFDTEDGSALFWD